MNIACDEHEQCLNLGCGKEYLQGWVNLDLFAEQVDVRANLNIVPYPFDDNTFDSVRCVNIIEHLNDPVIVMQEIHRICRPGAQVYIRVPHFRSACLYEDITHRHGFAWKSFDIFLDQGEVYGEYTGVRFKMINRWYTHYKIKPLYHLLSRCPVLTDHLFSKFIPMASIVFELEVTK